MSENIGGTQGHEQELVSVEDLKETLQEYKNELTDKKYDLPSGGIPYSDLASAVQALLDKADTAIQSHQDISGKADVSDLSALEAIVSAIRDLIPSQAADNNQLADKSFVNSSISTATATYKGSY